MSPLQRRVLPWSLLAIVAGVSLQAGFGGWRAAATGFVWTLLAVAFFVGVPFGLAAVYGKQHSRRARGPTGASGDSGASS